MELINIQHTNKKTSTKNNTSIFFLTKEGVPCSQDGIEYIRQSLKDKFNITDDLSIYTGIRVNEPTVLAKFIQTANNPYVVFLCKNGVGFFPASTNEAICENLKEGHELWPDMTSWQIIMKNCNMEDY